MSAEVRKEYEPKKYEAKCLDPDCPKIWRAMGSNWPVSAAKRHTQVSGHRTSITGINVLYYLAEGTDDE